MFMSSRGYLNEEEMKEDIRKYIIKQKCMYTVGKGLGIELTDVDVDEKYTKHKIQNKRVDIRHILISTVDREKDETGALVRRFMCNDGGDFETLAKQYSDDEETKDSGGLVKGLTAGVKRRFLTMRFSQHSRSCWNLEVYNGYEIVGVDKEVNYYRNRNEYAQMLMVDMFVQSDKYKEWFEELKKGYDIEITDLAMKAFRLLKRNGTMNG